MAKVEVLFIDVNGRVSAESVPSGRQAIEFKDGLKPFLSDGVYFDEQGIGPPICVYWYGRIEPEGVSLTTKEMEAMIVESVHVTQHKMKYPTSRRWARIAIKALTVFFKSLILGFVIASAAFLTITILTVLT